MIRWSVCISKSQRSLCVSFSRSDSWLFIYHLLVCSSGQNYYHYHYCYYYLLCESFSHQRLLMVFHLSPSDTKFSQVSRTLLSILGDLNNAVVWMVSSRHQISKSSSPFINTLVTVTRAPITIGITVFFMLHSFFNSQAGSRYSSFYSLSFNFSQWSAGTAKFRQVFFFVDNYMVSFFNCCCCWLLKGLAVWTSGRD